MSLSEKGLLDQHLIRQNMHQLSDQLESLQNWEKDMKEDDRKRTASMETEGKLDNEKNDTNEAKLTYMRYKDAGNVCFQDRNYQQAIANYNLAISSAISEQDASVLYSNRAQCEILLHLYAEAVESCTKSVELDPNGVKAWFRLMTAQDKLQNYDVSLAAAQRVLELTPTNKTALEHVQKIITQKPVKRAYTSLLDGQGEDVQFIDKPPHMRSRVPLKRLIVVNPVEEVEEMKTPVFVDEKQVSVASADEKQVSVASAAEPKEPKTIDMDFIEKTVAAKVALPAASSTAAFAKSNKNMENSVIRSDQLLCRPISSSEFCREWRSKNSAAERYAYLRIIPAEDLPKLLDSMLESDLLSQLLQIFARNFVENDVPPIDYLLQLTRCKELSILSLMQTAEDHQALKTILEYTKTRNERVIREVSKGFSM